MATEPKPDADRLLAALRQAGIRPGIAYSVIVAAILKQRRESLALSQRELAVRANLTQPALSRIELGDSVVDVDQLLVLAEALDTSPSAILLDAEEITRRLREHDVDVARRRDQAAADSVISAAGASALLHLFGTGATLLSAPPKSPKQNVKRR